MRPIHERSTPRPRRGTAGAAIGGILAALAVLAVIVVGWILIRDGGTNDVQVEAEQQSARLRDGFDAAEARARLATLRADIEAGLDESAIRERYDDVRADLEAGYADASGEAARTWETLQVRLNELGERIGASSEEALASVDAVLDAFPEE